MSQQCDDDTEGLRQRLPATDSKQVRFDSLDIPAVVIVSIRTLLGKLSHRKLKRQPGKNSFFLMQKP
ncbi:MAG TPA: hypothetical protein PLG73_15505, partial [Candidatus Sumerlaeota bacterium]|nr:hypothetical protein [Candidatus Sumerlaeota bacterium]